MILSRHLYNPPSFFKKIFHSWKWRSFQRHTRLRKLMGWDGLSFEERPYFYSPRLILNPEYYGQASKLRSDLCPTEAITWKQHDVEIDLSVCIRCAFCLEAEPQNFRSSHDLDHFLKS